MGRRFGGSANSRHVFQSRDNYRVVVCAVVDVLVVVVVVVVVVGVERRRGCWCW